MSFLDLTLIHPVSLKSLPIRDWLKKLPDNPMTVKSRLRALYKKHGADYAPQFYEVFKPQLPKPEPEPEIKIELPKTEPKIELPKPEPYMNIFDLLVPHAPTMHQFELHRTHFGLTSAETLLQFMKWGAEASRYHIVADEQAREAELREALETIKASIVLSDAKPPYDSFDDEDDDFFTQYEKPPVVPPLAPDALASEDWEDLINQELGF